MSLPSIPTLPNNQPPLVVSPEQVSNLLFNTLLAYGPTGSRKTSQIGKFARYIYETTGKKTRLISADLGGWAPIQPEIDLGIIEAWRIIEEPNPRTALIKASRGGWPEKMVNGVRTSQRLQEYLPQDRHKGLKDIGAYAVEGFASIARSVMRDSVSKGRKTSEDVVAKFSEGLNPGDTSDLESYGAPSRSHYGDAQNYTLDYVRNFSSLPGLRVLYTSLEGKGIDKIDNVIKYGPEVAGGALTAAIPTYVGDCLHFEDFIEELGPDPNNPKQKLVEPRVRVWFQQHPDSASPTGTMWPAKARVVPDRVADFKKLMGPNGYFVLGDNKEPDLGTYLRAQDEMLKSSKEGLVEWKRMIDEKRKSS